MGKKLLHRIHRSAPLSTQEASRDRELRKKIEAEFPPLQIDPVTPVLSYPLKKAIAASRKPMDQLAKEAGVSQAVFTRFLAGEGDLRLTAADKLASVLRLKLVGT